MIPATVPTLVALTQLANAVKPEAASGVRQKGKAKELFSGLFEVVTVTG